MRFSALVHIAVVALSGTASAQQLNSFEARDVRAAVQCELGEFARELYRAAPQPMIKAMVELSVEKVTVKATEGKGGIIGYFSGSRTYEVKNEHTVGTERNVH